MEAGAAPAGSAEASGPDRALTVLTPAISNSSIPVLISIKFSYLSELRHGRLRSDRISQGVSRTGAVSVWAKILRRSM